MTSVDQGADHAVVAYREGDRPAAVAAGYVVGCDGARSLVREQVTYSAEDLGFHERWLVLDLLLHKDRPDLGDFTVQYCHPDSPATYVRGPGLRRRWEISIGNVADGLALAPDNLWCRLKRWLTPDEAAVERAAVYTFHSVISSSWRQGRLLIAGDAAHQSPPFMGQGMCAGIRDAANLAWKLALCIRHGHDDALLASYQSERHPHVRAFIKGAVDLGRLVNASDSEAALKSAFRQPDGSYKMTTISPRLGPGVWQAGSPAAGHISRSCASERARSRTNSLATARPSSPRASCWHGGKDRRMPRRRGYPSGIPPNWTEPQSISRNSEPAPLPSAPTDMSTALQTNPRHWMPWSKNFRRTGGSVELERSHYRRTRQACRQPAGPCRHPR